jgi:hypothetical protein
LDWPGEQARASAWLQAGQVVADRRVVVADAVERGHRQRELRLAAERAVGLQFGQDQRLYCEASVTTPTSFQFLAALRTMAGPPMSMFSIASSSVQPALADGRLERDRG